MTEKDVCCACIGAAVILTVAVHCKEGPSKMQVAAFVLTMPFPFVSFKQSDAEIIMDFVAIIIDFFLPFLYNICGN